MLRFGAKLRGAQRKNLQYEFEGGVGSLASLAAPPRLVNRAVIVVRKNTTWLSSLTSTIANLTGDVFGCLAPVMRGPLWDSPSL